MNTKFIRQRITDLRLLRNLSEYKLSIALGHSKGYIQSIASGHSMPSLESFLEICDYFNITPYEFFNDQLTLERPQIQQILYYLQQLPDHDLEMIKDIARRCLEAAEQQETGL